MGTPPQNTPEERQSALRAALEARQERAHLKQRIHDGEVKLGDLLDKGRRGATDELGEHARVAGRIEVGDALLAVKGIGPVHAAQILADAGIENEHEHLDELSAAQRESVQAGVIDAGFDA